MDRGAWKDTAHGVAESDMAEWLTLSLSYISGITQYLSFHEWYILLHIISSRFLHVVANSRTSFLFKAE